MVYLFYFDYILFFVVSTDFVNLAVETTSRTMLRLISQEILTLFNWLGKILSKLKFLDREIERVRGEEEVRQTRGKQEEKEGKQLFGRSERKEKKGSERKEKKGMIAREERKEK